MSEISQLPSLADFANAEHCVLEDTTGGHPALTDAFNGDRQLCELTEEVRIVDKLRGRLTRVRLYAEGWVDIEVERRRRQWTHHRIDLRYLDPRPISRQYYPVRLLKATAILAGITGVLSIPALFGWLPAITMPAAAVGLTATLGSAFVAIYLSHEKIVFRTRYGRAAAIRFGAGLGTIRRFRKLVPRIVNGIVDAAEAMHDERHVYLRAEMREHYRLQKQGTLTDRECTVSTSRILDQFDKLR